MPTAQSTYVWRRIRRDKVDLVLNGENDWVMRNKPNLEAATRAVADAWRNARPETATVAWTPGPDLLAKAAVFAALGITEDTDA